jgi:hypothetical protein
VGWVVAVHSSVMPTSALVFSCCAFYLLFSVMDPWESAKARPLHRCSVTCYPHFYPIFHAGFTEE